MDFFQRQENARRSTRRLVVLFLAAVVGVVVAVNAAVAVLFLSRSAEVGTAADLFQPQIAAGVTLVTLAIIAGGSLYKTAVLARGGSAVAELLGGKPVDPNSRDRAERRLLNVVEEMALAAGTAVPTVWVLERERGINAFAAGLRSDDAVIGVTRGALELLDRDQLQGVIGHEVSHILNGDSRLNVRLMGILHGILVIGLIGYWILRSHRYGASDRRRGGGAAILLFGLALVVIGYVGVFFGRLIKSGVSRQREFLADAASAQFTRNPRALASALQTIGGLSSGSRLVSPSAEQASHLFFGNGLGPGLFPWLDTHPPLVERIRRLDPSWDGTFPKIEPLAAERPPQAPAATAAAGRPRPSFARAAAASLAAARRLEVEPALASVGSPRAEHLAYAAALRDRLPADLRDRAHEPASARAIVCALLLSDRSEVLAEQLRALAVHAGDDPALLQEVGACRPDLERCPPEARLALLDLTVPALRRMSKAQWLSFDRLTTELVEADQRLDVFELSLRRVLRRHVEPEFVRRRAAPAQYYSLKRLAPECSLVLSALAWSGEAGGAEAAFACGAAHLPGVPLALRPELECNPASYEANLRRLGGAALRHKSQLLRAAAATIAHDRRVDIEEGELLRALADALGCPMPPLLPGEFLA